jgi:branched-chain amino acid aminotransferase
METVIWHDGRWHEDANPPLMGGLDQAFWMSTVVFDGARAFDGWAPDLDRHCERLLRSARSLLMNPPVEAAFVERLCREAIRKFEPGAHLYVRPMIWAREGFILPEADSADFALAVLRAPVAEFSGMSVCLSSQRRPGPDMAPTDAKASCLYPNTQRAVTEAKARGFDGCVLLDPWDNVAELATSNIWIARDGVALTPAANGTFLAGVTRARVMALLREAGVEVREATLKWADVMAADEVFTTGNYSKVQAITRVEDRRLQPGPIARKARELYWAFARTQPV